MATLSSKLQLVKAKRDKNNDSCFCSFTVFGISRKKHEQKAFLIELYSYLVNNLLLGGRGCVNVCMCMCMCVCVCMCVCGCVCACMRACVCGCGCVCAFERACVRACVSVLVAVKSDIKSH